MMMVTTTVLLLQYDTVQRLHSKTGRDLRVHSGFIVVDDGSSGCQDNMMVVVVVVILVS